MSRPSGIQLSKEVPSLLIEVDLKAPVAWVRIPAKVASALTDHQARNTNYLWAQRVELGRFVQGCVARRFVWAPGLNQRIPLEIWAAKQDCWKCHRPTSIITRLDFRVDRLVPGAQRISLSVEDFDSLAGTSSLTEALRQADLKSLGIGAVRSRFSHTRGSAYLSNGCVHCDALQGAHFEHEVAYDAEPTLTVECTMAEGIFTDEVQGTPFRWAFDESFGANDQGPAHFET
jgi:hypothetical protein